MTNLIWLLYFINIANSLNTVTMILSIISFAVGGIAVFAYFIARMAASNRKDPEYESAQYKEWCGYRATWLTLLRYAIPIFVVLSVVTVIIPSYDTMNKMLALHVTGEVAEQISSIEGANALPEKTIQALDKMLSEYIEEPTEE